MFAVDSLRLASGLVRVRLEVSQYYQRPKDPNFAIEDVIPTLSDDQIIDILQYHVAGAIQFRENLQQGQDIIMLNGETVTVSAIIDDLITLQDQSGGEDAIIEEVNIQGGNGVVHVVDKVLLPF